MVLISKEMFCKITGLSDSYSSQERARRENARRELANRQPLQREDRCVASGTSRQQIPEFCEPLSNDDAETVLWQAIQDIRIGNKTDDKLILKNLRDRGVVLARSAISTDTAGRE